jgi:hypothetical protein
MLSLLPTFARAVWLDSFCRENVENRLSHHFGVTIYWFLDVYWVLDVSCLAVASQPDVDSFRRTLLSCKGFAIAALVGEALDFKDMIPPREWRQRRRDRRVHVGRRQPRWSPQRKHWNARRRGV